VYFKLAVATLLQSIYQRGCGQNPNLETAAMVQHTISTELQTKHSCLFPWRCLTKLCWLYVFLTYLMHATCPKHFPSLDLMNLVFRGVPITIGYTFCSFLNPDYFLFHIRSKHRPYHSQFSSQTRSIWMFFLYRKRDMLTEEIWIKESHSYFSRLKRSLGNNSPEITCNGRLSYSLHTVLLW